MNHSSGTPYGQLPQRRHEIPFSPMLSNIRPQPGYPHYYQPHIGAPMPPYPQHYPQQWYPYQHMQHHPMPQPSRQYQHHPQFQHPQPHSPLVVSSFPQGHAPTVAAHTAPLQSVQQHSTPAAAAAITVVASPTTAANLPSPFSPPKPSIASEEQRKTPSAVQTESVEVKEVTSMPDLVENEPFYPPVPWLSVGNEPFPSRAPPRKRKIARSSIASEPVIFPLALESQVVRSSQENQKQAGPEIAPAETSKGQAETLEALVSKSVQSPTPQTSDVPSEPASTQPTTPSSVITTQAINSQQAPTPSKSSRPVVPIIPAVPILPSSPTTPKRVHRDSIASTVSRATASGQSSSTDAFRRSSSTSLTPVEPTTSAAAADGSKPASPPRPPKSWADLVRSKAPSSSLPSGPTTTQLQGGILGTRNETLSEVLSTMTVTTEEDLSKIAFLKPRGLVNTGNMCYMNSILQILVFCVPFYQFIDRVSSRAIHNFKSDTPLIDAMIMFIKEFSIIDSAQSVSHLRLRLKQEDFEQYGEPLIPEYAYQAIRQVPRFRDMRRGHQQDAQEFLGFLLEELHEECVQAMRSSSSANSGASTPIGSHSNMSEATGNDGGWMEVGHKQRAAITRSSGTILTESPVTKIFGGKLRSELKVSGNRISVTLEPYQPLQLDIGSPQVHNIVDALKGLTRPESMQGDFDSPRGPKATATKQVFIETLPPVLILHLKRFQYDNTSKRAEKIWKRVGYPLELEIPREVFPPQARNRLAAHGGFPRYRLIGAIYHHGKHASGGHYTVDVRRQEGQEWIRLDDTLIRRIRSEDVAEGGSEEDPRVLAAALERHRQQKPSNSNMFEQIDQEDDEDKDVPEQAWSQVNGHSRTKSTVNAAANGSATPIRDASGKQTPSQKFSVKDNKVAYLLFYQRI